MRALDPALALARGWSITRDTQGRVVRSVSGVESGDVVTTQLIDGDLASTITARTHDAKTETQNKERDLRGDDMNDNQAQHGGNDDSGDDETIGYADAMAELERILRDLEGDDLDVDMLASRVERASFLIGLCRKRIGAARVQVERVVANLDSEPEAEADAEVEDDDLR